jgi:hypothetical protein
MANDKEEVIRIAVTGHRLLDTPNKLTSSIQKVFAQIIQDHPGLIIIFCQRCQRVAIGLCQDCSAV